MALYKISKKISNLRPIIKETMRNLKEIDDEICVNETF